MKMVGVEKRDIYFLMEFSLEDIKKLLIALNHCQIDYDSSDEEINEAVNFLKGKFHPYFDAIANEYGLYTKEEE